MTAILKRLSNTAAALTLWRVLLLYAVMMLCRIIFTLCNLDSFSHFTWAELPALIAGSLQFDTASLVYIDGLWLVLSLLPFRFREKEVWQKSLFRLYFTVNTLGIICINLADAVYFRYTQ